VIDFRYHLVSLISVFLALAVGIALGAGPLKETIGDTLTGQVSQLREEKDALRAELDSAQSELANGEQFLEAISGSLLGGALEDRRIGFVILDEVPEGELAELEAAFVEAGASVPTRVRVSERWTAEEDRVFRSALAARLVEYLEPGVDQSANADEILAAALAQSIAGKDPANPTGLSANAEVLAGLLSAEDGALVESLASDGGPVDAIVVLSSPEPPTEPEAQASESPAADPEAEQRAVETVLRAQAAIALAAQQRSEGAILAADPYVEGELLAYVRASEELAERLSTVSRFSTTSGRISTVLGLGARIALRVGHFGVEPDADAAAPSRVELPPVDRSPVVPPGDELDQEGEDPDAEQDGESGEEEDPDAEQDGESGEEEDPDAEQDGGQG